MDPTFSHGPPRVTRAGLALGMAFHVGYCHVRFADGYAKGQKGLRPI